MTSSESGRSSQGSSVSVQSIDLEDWYTLRQGGGRFSPVAHPGGDRSS